MQPRRVSSSHDSAFAKTSIHVVEVKSGGSNPASPSSLNAGAVSKMVRQQVQHLEQMDVLALLTQAEQRDKADSISASSTGVTYTLNYNELTLEQRKLYARCRLKPLNLSPIDHRRFVPMLSPQPEHVRGRKTLLLDIDETLCHSSFDAPPNDAFDFRINCPDARSGQLLDIFVRCRPHLLPFLREVSSLFEVVLFTASVGAYCLPLADELVRRNRKETGDSSSNIIHGVLWRDHCTCVGGKYVKDLSLLGRDLSQIALLDNSAHTYVFQPLQSVAVSSFFGNAQDSELLDLLPMLRALAQAPDVFEVLRLFRASRKQKNQ